MSLYFVECIWLGCLAEQVSFFPERNTEAMTRSKTILDIRYGQLENVRRVIEVELDGSPARDVTEDIALEVLALFDEEPSGQVRDFLEEHCSDSLAEHCDELATARSDRDEHSTHYAALSGVS